jgi:CheY-like chemotaxis protein
MPWRRVASSIGFEPVLLPREGFPAISWKADLNAVLGIFGHDSTPPARAVRVSASEQMLAISRMVAKRVREGSCMIKVVIVEDDLMIADMAKETLVEYGYEVCGIARTVTEAVVLCRRRKPDLAVIDVRLNDGSLADGWLGTDVVARLSSMGRLGVLYASGNLTRAMMTVIGGHACLAKPYSSVDLVRGLEIVAEIVATGTASPPFPRGFRVLPSTTTAPYATSFPSRPASRRTTPPASKSPLSERAASQRW